MRQIRVLMVEDSLVEQQLLLHVLESDPEIKVVSVAADGEQAVEYACRDHPDVITMDVHMPKMGGLEATRFIMASCPAPIVVVSGSAAYGREGEKAFFALEQGALALAKKPPGVGHPGHAAAVQELLQTVKLMSEVKVVKRWASTLRPPPELSPRPVRAAEAKIVAIGASAGGPQAIQYILANLPKNFPVPILIVQHIAPGFTSGFAAWLTDSTGFAVHVAESDQQARAGNAYVAPDLVHMGVSDQGRILLSDSPAEGGLKPAVSHLFRSVKHGFGASAVGVLLTGMGRDGALELRAMKDAGAITIAQDRESSMVFGMPGEAVSLAAASYVLPLDRIPPMLMGLTNRVSAQ